MAVQNIPKLTEQQKQLLLSKSAFSLPDNPSDKHFSSAQIKRKMYEGLLVLFDYINAFIDSVNSNVTLSNQDLQTMQSDIGTLQSFFENGICKKATADANGDNIASTYETKSDALSEIATALAEAKAYADALVQRSALVNTLGEASISVNGLMSAEDKRHLDLLFSMLGSSPEEISQTFAHAIELLSEAEKTYFISDTFDSTFVENAFSTPNVKVMYYDDGWKEFENVTAYQTWATDKTINHNWIASNDSDIGLSTLLDTDEYCIFKCDNGTVYLIDNNGFQHFIKNGDEVKTFECTGKAVDRKYFNGKLYAYQAKGEPNTYKSVKVDSTSITTLGQLRAFIEEINARGEHCLFDFSDFSTNAYVCTVLMYSSGDLQNCLIFDIINGQTYADYYGYDDSTTIQRFFTVENANRHLSVGNIPRVIKIHDNGQMLSTFTFMKSIKTAYDLQHNIFFDFSAFLPAQLSLDNSYMQRPYYSKRLSFCAVEISNDFNTLNNNYYTYVSREQGLMIIYDLITGIELWCQVNNNGSVYNSFSRVNQAYQYARGVKVMKPPKVRIFYRLYQENTDLEIKLEMLQHSAIGIRGLGTSIDYDPSQSQMNEEQGAFTGQEYSWKFTRFINNLCDNFSFAPSYSDLYKRSFLATGYYNTTVEEEGVTYDLYLTVEEIRVEKISSGGNASTAVVTTYMVCRGIKKNTTTGELQFNVPYEFKINKTNFPNLRIKEQIMTFK